MYNIPNFSSANFVYFNSIKAKTNVFAPSPEVQVSKRCFLCPNFNFSSLLSSLSSIKIVFHRNLVFCPQRFSHLSLLRNSGKIENNCLQITSFLRGRLFHSHLMLKIIKLLMIK